MTKKTSKGSAEEKENDEKKKDFHHAKDSLIGRINFLIIFLIDLGNRENRGLKLQGVVSKQKEVEKNRKKNHEENGRYNSAFKPNALGHMS